MSDTRSHAMLRAAMRQGAAAMLFTDPLSIRFLAGVRDARWALLTRRGRYLMPYPLSATAMRRDAPPSWRVLDPNHGGAGVLGRRLAADGATRVGFESDLLPWSAAERLRRELAGRCLLVAVEGIVAAARAVKDVREQGCIRRSAAIAREAGAALFWHLRTGMSEREAAAWLDRRMIALGADGPAFDSIVLFGAHSALPHGIPGDRRLRRGDLVLVDWGAKLDGYHSDITRVRVCGRPTGEQRRAYRAVLAAYLRAAAMVRSGRRAEEPDLAARGALGPRAATFMHSLGHGVGLAIHEEPRLARGQRALLRAGQVVTVEPGIYVNGWGGIRLEDTWLVTRGAPVSLTGAPLPELVPLPAV